MKNPAGFWSDLSLRNKGLLVVLVPLISLLVTLPLALFSRPSGEPLARPAVVSADASSRAAGALVESVQEVSQSVGAAEAALRRYFRTRRPDPLAQFRRLVGPQLDAQLRRMMDLARRLELEHEFLGLDRLVRAQLVRQLRDLLERFQTSGRVPENPRYLGARIDAVNGALAEAFADADAREEELQLAALQRSVEQRRQALEATERRRRGQLVAIAGVALFGLAAGLVATTTFTRSITRRIRAIEEGARGLARGGQTPSLPGGADELGSLGRELEGAGALLQERERGLVAAKNEADAANAAKSEFLSRMSHELRTPLNAILGFGQLLQLENLPPPQRESVDQIVNAGHHLLGLINEILDIARIEAGRVTFSMEPVDLPALVAETRDLVRPLLLERSLHLTASTSGDKAVYALADRQRLKQVMLNLLSNAIKYNRKGGAVQVATGGTEDGRVHITVDDTGVGIEADRLDRLFDPFERLDADAKGVEGTGLGLALSKRLVEAMGGDIFVTSEVDVGTRLIVELAAADAPGDEEVALMPESRSAAK